VICGFALLLSLVNLRRFSVAAIGLQLVQRSVIAGRFRQDRRVIALHAPSLVLLTAIQWWSLVMHLTGRRSWRGRTA
jgi:hypothetical protein